ncbi:AfsR/SARP family transcriptional regulator [Kutzneria buriramensis]|uniref:DNA-binding SARP family transcriptional activator n=1 Tax=Kutzneria buriramensis TaxID=1045776 RepID=A0A3E0HLF5_9PSEU|nr:AfsR/SARP family transcriptional regulator [Kutzneria buriramensis]REH47036.1 DNA-binding SARP family transcriptional activator [Kutzneria buriramensis]
MIRIAVLGTLELHTEEGVYVPRGPKVRKVLALLALRANQLVDVDTIADELWDSRHPRTAVTTIRTHVYHLRKMLEQETSVPMLSELLLTQHAGYMLRLETGQLDAELFRTAVDRGRAQLARGRYEEAAEVLRGAVALWRGPTLANVPLGPVLTSYVDHLRELRIRALEMRVEAEMRLGHHRELVPELRKLVAANPFNEWLHARLIDALRLSGRRREALEAFRALRTLLDEELGLEPSAELQQLQYDILTASRAS